MGSRWTTVDPAGIKDGPNVYLYCSDNPIRLHDPSGTDGKDKATDSGIIKVDLGEVFRSKEWKEQIKKVLEYTPKLMSREEERAWRESREAEEEKEKQKTDKPAAGPEPPDPPQPLSPPGSAYQSAAGQPLGGFSAGGYAQWLRYSNYASQYSITGGLAPGGGDLGAEALIQGVHTIDPTGTSAGSLYGGVHGWYGPNAHMYNVAAYVLFGNTWGQNPEGASGGNFGVTGILVGEKLFGPDRDHPRVTLGGNVSLGYLHYLQVSPTGQPATPPPPSTNLVDTGNASGVVNVTTSWLYSGKTPRLVLWGEAYGSVAWGTYRNGRYWGKIAKWRRPPRWLERWSGRQHPIWELRQKRSHDRCLWRGKSRAGPNRDQVLLLNPRVLRRRTRIRSQILVAVRRCCGPSGRCEIRRMPTGKRGEYKCQFIRTK